MFVDSMPLVDMINPLFRLCFQLWICGSKEAFSSTVTYFLDWLNTGKITMPHELIFFTPFSCRFDRFSVRLSSLATSRRTVSRSCLRVCCVFMPYLTASARVTLSLCLLKTPFSFFSSIWTSQGPWKRKSYLPWSLSTKNSFLAVSLLTLCE